MKSIGKKGYFVKHAKSSAALVSLGIHAVLIVVALSFVAVTVIQKEDQRFEAKKVNRPRVQLKKLQVPVKVKQRKEQKPKLRKNIVANTKVKSMNIKMPELIGIKGGMGYLDEGGLGSLGFSIEINLFGGDKGSGNELEGRFFDLKKTPDGKPNKMAHTSDKMAEENAQNQLYVDALRNFAATWNISRLEKEFFSAPKSKFATTFMMPKMDASEAPKAYSVEGDVMPKRWAAYYVGKFAAPETGRYRFWGIADDVMVVQVKGDVVIDASYPGLKGKITDWESKDERNRKIKAADGEQGLVIGDWFSLTQGRPTDIEVLIGERPGGQFYCRLFIEQDGVDYPEGRDGMPILPVFKTQKIPDNLIPLMGVDPQVGTTEGPLFGVLK